MKLKSQIFHFVKVSYHRFSILSRGHGIYFVRPPPTTDAEPHIRGGCLDWSPAYVAISFYIFRLLGCAFAPVSPFSVNFDSVPCALSLSLEEPIQPQVINTRLPSFMGDLEIISNLCVGWAGLTRLHDPPQLLYSPLRVSLVHFLPAFSRDTKLWSGQP